MATVSKGSAATSDSLAVGTWRGGSESDSKSDRYLAQRLAAASADYKGVALTTFLLAAGVAGFLWLACGILVEHWLLPGGLPRPVRWAWLAVGGIALGAAIIRWLVPLVRYRVNLVYAARAIEQEYPELHNDLVNTVLVKAHPEASPPLVVQSLERRTAKRLSGVPAEAVVDRTTPLRLAYVLAALVGLACLYEVAAPKSLAVTAARLLAPWIGWAAPSRVRIEPLELAWRMPGEKDGNAAAAGGGLERRRIAVDSGAATLVRGRQLVVSAGIRGLRRDEEPIVTVSPLQSAAAAALPAGGVAASWQAKMVRGETAASPQAAGAGSSKRFAVVLPDTVRGLDHSVEIAIAAGDARSEPVRIAVVDSPALLVREVRYDYPAYTRKQSEAVEWQGDIRAVEGTQVTLVAESNQPLEDAWIDFDCDGDHDLKFNKKANDLARVTKSFELQMNADRSGPQHAMYRLRFLPRATSASAREPEVTEPMEHRIEVIADLAPEVSIEDPRESPLRVPPAAAVAVRVRALDPDFALARVGVETRLKGGPTQPEITLLAEEKTGVFKGLVRLVPERLGAGPGSVLEYRAVAVDTRPKTPNTSHSPWQSLQIDASAKPRPQDDPVQPSGGQQGDRAGEATGDQGRDSGREEGGDAGSENPAAGDGDQGARDEGKPADDSAGGQKQPGQPQPRAEGQTTDPQKRQQSQGQQAERQKQQPEKQDQEKQDQQNGQQGEPNQGEQSGAADGSQQGGKQQTPGESQRGDQQGAGKNEGQGADQGQGTGAQGNRSGGQQSGKQQSDGGGRENAGDNNAGGKQSGGKQSGGKESGGKESGGKESGGKESGGKESGGSDPAQNAGKNGGQRGDKKQPNPAVASDGTNDGEAMERILENRRQEGGSEKSGSEKQTKSPEGGQPKDQNNSQNQNQPPCAGADGKPCGKEGCSSCSGGDKPGTGGGKQSGGQQGDGKQGGGKQGGGKEAGGKEGGEGERSGESAGGEKNGAGEAGSGKQSGSQPSGDAGKADGNDGKGEAGKGGAGKPGADAGQSGTGKQPQEKPGQGQQPGQGTQASQEGSQQGDRAEKTKQDDSREQGNGRERREGGYPQNGQQPAPSAGEQAGSGESGNTESGESGKGRGPDRKQGPTDGPPQPTAGKPGAASSETGSGGWSGGDGPQQPGKPLADGRAPAKETEWGEQDLANARNAADLAIEHLRGAVESGRTDVLDQLGWTREQASAFLDRWEKMRRLAESGDPVQRGEFERAVRSLGLRPDGVRSSRDVPSDVKGGQAEGRRSRPPTDYREQFKAYTQGTAGE